MPDLSTSSPKQSEFYCELNVGKAITGSFCDLWCFFSNCGILNRTEPVVESVRKVKFCLLNDRGL